MWVAGTDKPGLAALRGETLEAPGPGRGGQRGTSVDMRPLTVKCQPPLLTDTIRSNLNDWLFWSGENSTDIM